MKKVFEVKSILMAILLMGFATNANALFFEFTFTSLDQAAIGAQALPTIGSTENTYAITNATGVTWTDFHLDSLIGGFTLGSFTGPGSSVFSGGVFTTLDTQWSETLDIFELNIASGDILSFTVSTFCAGEACGFGTVYTAFPTIAGGDTGNGGTVSVPEPGTLLLMATGLFGLGFAGRKKK